MTDFRDEHGTADSEQGLRLEALVDISVLQAIQDAFSSATGVASIITDPSGRPITRPSNFCRLCSEIIRKTPQGLVNCMKSDAAIGRPDPSGPIIQPCLSGGLYDGGASIMVGNRHIANWLIGQVVDESLDRESILSYAREIGADEAEFVAALSGVTAMPRAQFEAVCQALFLIAKQISTLAYQNVQLGREVERRKRSEDGWREANEELTCANEELMAAEEELRQRLEELGEREQTISESERRFREILENARLAAVILDVEGRIVFCNDYILSLTGYEREEVLYRDWFETFVPEPQRSRVRATFAEVLAREDSAQLHFRYDILTRSGERRIISWNRTKMRDNAGHLIGLTSIGEDITERMRAEADLERTNQRVRHILESIADAFFALGPDGEFTYVNARAAQVFRRTREELLGRIIWEAFPEIKKTSLRRDLRRAAVSRTATTIEYFHEPTGFWFEIHAYPSQDGLSVYFRDITERKRTEEASRHAVYHDQLTDLPNRLFFSERLAEAIGSSRRDGRQPAILFVDLDNFKNINDSLGHIAGDELLCVVAKRLAGFIQGEDVVARMGGDEFTVLAVSVDGAEEAAAFARRINELFREPFSMEGRDFYLTVSIGIALYPWDGEDAVTLLRNADTAMYRAKDTGRNRSQFFTPVLNERVQQRVEMDTNLRQALVNKEFVLHYQPQVEISSGSIVGLEALLRWHHPVKGLVPPGDFIPLAEETGLIVPIGEWVISHVCEQLREWREAGLPLVPVSVNLSARQFQQSDLAGVVERALEGTGLSPALLGMEITEGVTLQDQQLAVETLARLRAMGVQVSLDDFGTGYSALSYLRFLPIDVVKLDKSFIRDLEADDAALAIASAVIAMAHHLSLKVVAEGVETGQQLALLKDCSCDAIQGFLYSRPVPASQAAEMLWSAQEAAAGS